MNSSSNANSFGDSWTSVSPRHTRRLAGSMRRSPTVTSAGLGRGAAADERPKPGDSSEKLNGFAR
ncbi:hypothetical protein [Streptomyces sp. NPDC055105]|uniref:hypothetical protein n=1 Tax=Streptomyces sp. NPDC055105 TaxID=3365719 RepID=UPI0037CEE01D